MFNSIFGKNKKNKQEKLEFPEDWDSFFCHIEDKPASIRLNLGLDQIAPIQEYSDQIWFSVKFMNPDENGFTTREEFDTICAIEDRILERLNEKQHTILAGTIKTDGRLDLYMYTTSTKTVESIVNSTMEDNFKDYLHAIQTKKDEKWEDYYNFLYPNAYEFQTMKNRKVLINLEKHGDNFDIKRPVDHWIYFKEKPHLQAFLEETKHKGYELIKEDQNNEREFQYSVNIVREAVVIPSEVNHYVWELVELANTHHGIYDGWGCPIAS